MGTIISPFVYQIKDDAEGLKQFKDDLVENTSQKVQEIMLQFPTVYIHIWKNAEDYEVYIGESNNIIQRTRQHYDSMSDETKWQHQLMVQQVNKPFGRLNCPIYCQRSQWFLSWLLSLV